MHILYKLFIRVFYLFQNIINKYYFNFGSQMKNDKRFSITYLLYIILN